MYQEKLPVSPRSTHLHSFNLLKKLATMSNSTESISDSLGQEIWSNILSITGDDPFTLYAIWLTILAHSVIFITSSSTSASSDCMGQAT